MRWGRLGAAGLLLRHRSSYDEVHYLLMHRARSTSHGGTWGLPGGAMHRGETPWEAALREADEEGVLLPPVSPHREHVHRDADGWTYTTFVVDVAERPVVEVTWEHTGHRWVTAARGARMRLHPDLARAWPRLTAADE